MRQTLADALGPNDYLLHADMWRFPTEAKVIDCGLGESNLLNVAAGIASQGNDVYIYGVAGFIIHRYEQLKFSARDFGSRGGKIIICNAGRYGYEKFGAGHALDDDQGIMDTLRIPVFQPDTSVGLLQNLIHISQYPSGIFYIRLGKDDS